MLRWFSDGSLGARIKSENEEGVMTQIMCCLGILVVAILFVFEILPLGYKTGGFEKLLCGIVSLILIFYLSFCLIPRQLGYKNIPDKIEKTICNEAKSTVVWYYGYCPES